MTRGLKIKAAVAAGVAVAAFVIAWAVWPSPAPPRARQYLDVSACLLTGSGGITPGTTGAQAWHTMESASLSSHVMVSYLPATGPADVPPRSFGLGVPASVDTPSVPPVPTYSAV